jgi:hypothetical protein
MSRGILIVPRGHPAQDHSLDSVGKTVRAQGHESAFLAGVQEVDVPLQAVSQPPAAGRQFPGPKARKQEFQPLTA